MSKRELSIYAREFNETCKGWDKDQAIQTLYLRHLERYFNDMLKARGYVMLNDVYYELGIPIEPKYHGVGWMLGKGDDFIDFGIIDIAMLKDEEYNIMLDFNVDGVIKY